MKDPKFTGSYYTPELLANFLVAHTFQNYLSGDELAILEPSCGDGKFIQSLFNYIQPSSYDKIDIDLYDIDSNELNKSLAHIPIAGNINIKARHQDYLSTFLEQPRVYNLIIGNPPYIRKRHMEDEQIDLCERCHDFARQLSPYINSKHKVNNIWTVFMELAVLSLTDDGILCFVLPSDILQVNYAKEIRELVQHEFDRVEIFAFNELIFDKVQQDVVAVIAIKKVNNESKKGFSFYQVDNLTDLKEPSFTEKFNNIHRSTLNKWTNYLLSAVDLNVIDILSGKYKSIDSYCKKISAGIVTAANDFFVVNNSRLKNTGLSEHNALKHILLKGSIVRPLVCFTEGDMELLVEGDERVFFIDIEDKPKCNLSPPLQEYINLAERTTDVCDRFKMKQRQNWYHVPNTWSSELLFTKRADTYPRLFYNAAGIIATDSFYRIIPDTNVKAQNLAFSFYNSLTLLLTEMEGRYYGGGVLELTPNEFKKLVIPYNDNISDAQFQYLDSLFRSKAELNTILDFTDSILLNSLSPAELSQIRNIRMKLVNRRKKSRVVLEAQFTNEYAEYE